MALVAIVNPPPPHSREFLFLPHSPWLLDIWVIFLMQNVPLDAALLFDLRAAILGWLLAAVQPKKALLLHTAIISKPKYTEPAKQT
jgi:hypothetical protein